MYKVIIVDDENIIRESLSMFIEGYCTGFVVEQTFEDGKDVIEYLKTADVDVVLTDIRMHEISGLQLLGFIHNFKPGIKTVIISGYKDFEYARAALEYRVANYLVKPTCPDELKKIFEQLYETLETERRSKLQLEENQKILTELLPMFQTQFFYDLITGVLQNEEEIQKRFESLMFDFSLYNSVVCVVEMLIDNYDLLLDKWSYGREQLKLALINIIKGTSGEIDCFYVDFKDNRLFLSLILKEQKNLSAASNFLKDRLNEVVEYCEQLIDFKVSIKPISDCARILDIKNAFDNGKFADITTNTNEKTDKMSSETTIQKAKKFIIDNLQKDLTLEEIAGQVFLNPIYFSRFFKQQTGENFTDYLISVRMQRAKELLLDSELKVYEISHMVGYFDNKHFGKLFKEESGLTPTEYRQKHRKI